MDGRSLCLRSHCVGASWEQLRDARCLEAMLCETHGSTEPSTTGTDDERVVRVVNNLVIARLQRGCAVKRKRVSRTMKPWKSAKPKHRGDQH